MTAEAVAQLVIDEVLEWRCGNPHCFYKPRLAMFGLNGGVHIHVSPRGRHGNSVNVVLDMQHCGSVRQHCSSCHQWRELFWSNEEQQVIEREATGYVPLIGCRCEFERYEQQLRESRAQEHGESTD